MRYKNKIDVDAPYGIYSPSHAAEIFYLIMNETYKWGWVGRRIFGRMRRLERAVSFREKCIADVVRFGLCWRLYKYDNVSEHRLLLRPNSFESVEIDAILALVEPGFTFIDVGANCGFYSLRIARALEGDGKVVSIEPHPVMRRRLEYNVNINSVPAPCIYGCVIGDRSGKVRLNEGKGNLGRTRVSADGTIEVEMRTLLDIVKDEQLERIDAVKVDVEGFEDRVLDSFLRDVPDRLLPRMIVAEFSWNDSWESDWLDRAKRRGYREKTRTGNQNVILVRS